MHLSPPSSSFHPHLSIYAGDEQALRGVELGGISADTVAPGVVSARNFSHSDATSVADSYAATTKGSGGA